MQYNLYALKHSNIKNFLDMVQKNSWGPLEKTDHNSQKLILRYYWLMHIPDKQRCPIPYFSLIFFRLFTFKTIYSCGLKFSLYYKILKFNKIRFSKKQIFPGTLPEKKPNVGLQLDTTSKILIKNDENVCCDRSQLEFATPG